MAASASPDCVFCSGGAGAKAVLPGPTAHSISQAHHWAFASW